MSWCAVHTPSTRNSTLQYSHASHLQTGAHAETDSHRYVRRLCLVDAEAAQDQLRGSQDFVRHWPLTFGITGCDTDATEPLVLHPDYSTGYYGWEQDR
eukprot:474140-Rhodomonas_salina.1